MEEDHDVFLRLYWQLRSPTGLGVEETSEHLTQLYKEPSSLHSLFYLVDTQEDYILRQHALLGICSCLGNCISELDAETILFCRHQVLIELERETNPLVRKAILRVISMLLDGVKAEWPEIKDGLWNINLPPDSKMILLSHYIYRISQPLVNQNLPNFIILIQEGLQSDDFEIVVAACIFLVSLVGNLNDMTPLNDSIPLFFQVFCKILRAGEAAKLNRVTIPLLKGVEKGFGFFPLSSLLEEILPILRDESFDFEYRMQIHSFLASMMIFYKDEDIQIDVISNLIGIEIYNAYNIFELTDIDPTMNWVYDVDIVLQNLFLRTYHTPFFEDISKQTIEFCQMENDFHAAIGILFLDNILSILPEYRIESRNEMLIFIVSSLRSQNFCIRKMAIRAIHSQASLFKTSIQNNLSLVVGYIIEYMKSRCAPVAVRLLNSILDCVTDTDAVYDEIMEMMPLMLQNPSTVIVYNAILIFSKLIMNSQFSAIQHLEEILEYAVNSIELNSPQSTIFETLSAICVRSNDLINNKLSQLMPHVLNGLQSEDPSVVADVVKFLNTAFKELPNEIIQYVDSFFMILHDLAIQKCPNEDYIIPSTAAEILCRIACQFQYQEVIDSINQIVSNFITSKLVIQALKAYCIAPEYMSQEIILRIIAISMHYLKDDDILPHAINAITITIKELPAFMLNYSEQYITFLLRRIQKTINNRTGDFVCDLQIYFPIFESIPVAITTLQVMVDETIKMLNMMLKSSSIRIKLFALQAYGEIFAELDSTLQESLLTLAIQNLETGNDLLAQGTATFLSNVSQNPLETVQIMGMDITNALFARIQRSTNPNLAENILAAISEVASNNLGEKFPYQEAMPLIVSFLPITHDTSTCESVYSFLASVIQLATPEMQDKLVNIFILALAHPYDAIASREDGVYLASALQNFLPIDEELRNQKINEVLDNDSFRIKCFMDSYNKMLSRGICES